MVVSSHADVIIVSRKEWNARAPKSIQTMSNPVPYVVIHHSAMPPACYTLKNCMEAMQWMQDLHQFKNSWVDIGYSFAVGSDGRAYEGRGWSTVGAHALRYNDKSIGICIIGDWTESLPPEKQLLTVKKLIEKGVKDGYIMKDYKLLGHKQVRQGTLCPGERLFNEICRWSQFCNEPDAIKTDISKIDK